MTDYGINRLGDWRDIHQDILQTYARAYTRVLKNQPLIRRVLYIDAFAGSGYGEDLQARQQLGESAVRALQVSPPFQELHFVESQREKAAVLEAPARDDPRACVHCRPEIDFLRAELLPQCRYEDYRRALCLLHPPDLLVPWSLVQAIGAMRSVDLFYTLMILDMNRNTLWMNPETVSPERRATMDLLWGDDSWRRRVDGQRWDALDLKPSSRSIEQIAQAFRRRLKHVAKFGYVSEPITIKSSPNGSLYYLFFASPNRTGARVVEQIFEKYKRQL